MDEERKVNIMTVELALKRELAYQKWLARLYPEDDRMNELLPREVPSATTMTSSFPSLTYFSGPHSISVVDKWTPVPNLCQPSTSRIQSQDPIRCAWANMEMEKASIHSISKERSTANTFQCLNKRWPQPIYISNSTNFFCKICQVGCSGPVSFKQHIRGQKHKAKMQSQQPTRNAGGENMRNQLRQSNVWCSGEDGLQRQSNGQKRKAKSQEVVRGPKGKASQQLWCELCQVACSHEDTYWLHLKGKSHLTNLQARGKKSRGM